MTYTELLAAVEGYLHRTDLAPQMALFSVLVEDELNQKLRAQEMISTLALTFTAPLNIPIEYLEMDGLYADTSSGKRILDSVTVDQLNKSAGGAVLHAYALLGSTFTFNVFTDQTGDMSYYARVLPVASNPTTPMLDKYPLLYTAGMLYQANKFVQDDEQSNYWLSKFNEQIFLINKQTKAGKFKLPRVRS